MATECLKAVYAINEVKAETEDPVSKKGCFAWGGSQNASSGSSPSQSEDLSADLVLRPNIRTNENSCASDEGTVTDDDSASLFVKRELNVSSAKSMAVNSECSLMAPDAKFYSFAEFEEAFDAWKREQLHPFRVASSETLKEHDGTVNTVFRYRYVVYHCIHYGEPRMRGVGKRPNQSYLPCGCHAMLRLNYNFAEQALKITTIVTQHTGHEQSPELFNKTLSKTRGSPAGRVKRERTSISSPLARKQEEDSQLQHALGLGIVRPIAHKPSKREINSLAALFSYDNEVKTEVPEPSAKRSRFEWGDSQDSARTSPSHSEDVSAIAGPGSIRGGSYASDEGTVTEDGFSHLFVKREPREPTATSSEFPSIAPDAKFHSFAEFEKVFDAWKREQLHPFRVASSETLRDPDGTMNTVFRYRYVVYHCVHYGEPRMRGVGKRPNQSYLPCGCHAMLRLNYSFAERALKITTLVTQHTGHEQSPEVFEKAISKTRGSPAARVKRERVSVSSPLTMRHSPTVSPTSAEDGTLTPEENYENLQRALGSGIVRPIAQKP